MSLVVKIYFILLIIPSAFAQSKVITLDEALHIALKDNMQIKNSERDENASEARLGRTRSYFLPKIGAESRFESIESKYQRQSGGTTNLFLEWNIFNGYRDSFNRSAKKFEFEQAKTASDRQKVFTKAELEAKFYKLLAVTESLKIYDDALKRNDSQKVSARKRRSAGLASDADILEFDLYQSELVAEKSKLQSINTQVQAEFREILGSKNEEIIYSPEGKLAHFHVDENLENLKRRMNKESQNLIFRRFAVSLAEINKKVAWSGYLPQVDLKATYGSRGINETVIAPETAIVGLVRWEFFSGFDSSFAIKEASAQAAKAEVALEQWGLSAITQLETAYVKLKEIQERVDVEAETRKKALKFFDVVSAEYKRGVKNSTDMRSASQLLLQVLIRDIQDRAEFFEQKSLLEKALGGEVRVSKGSLSGHVD